LLELRSADREESSALSQKYVSLARSIEQWFDEVLRTYDTSGDDALKYVNEAFERNLLANMQYHKDLQASANNDPTISNYHEQMVRLYQLLSTEVEMNGIVKQNNELLKGNRQIMLQISDMLNKANAK
jgi:hypothetical protein